MVAMSQKDAWQGFELLDRYSPLVNEDWSTWELDPDTAKALQEQLGEPNPAGVRQFLRELTNDLGLGSNNDLGGYTLTDILQGILA